MKFAYLIEPPFNHRDGDGVITGTDVELAKFVADELSLEEFEPIETEFAELLPGVATGKWQMTTGLFATEERKTNAAFSIPIWALPDGLLVPAGNPKELVGYRSVAELGNCSLAVIRDQVQHRSAVEFGIHESKLRIFETFSEAANAVREGHADAYASVARAHTGYIALHDEQRLDVVTVPSGEKEPEFGSFAFNILDNDFRNDVDDVIRAYYGTHSHRQSYVLSRILSNNSIGGENGVFTLQGVKTIDYCPDSSISYLFSVSSVYPAATSNTKYSLCISATTSFLRVFALNNRSSTSINSRIFTEPNARFCLFIR